MDKAAIRRPRELAACECECEGEWSLASDFSADVGLLWGDDCSDSSQQSRCSTSGDMASFR